MEPGEYEGFVAKAHQGGYNAAVELLQCMRTHKVYQPETVILYGGKLLKDYQRKLGSELWTVLEQVFLAAIAIGHDEWRDYCVRKLQTQWPTSVRVERLKGLSCESKKDWEEAKKVYVKIITDKPEDTVSRKRLIAIYRQRGQTEQAIEEINKYLDTFSTDSEVWHELAEIYIEAGSLQRAVYCFEELVLSNPRGMYFLLTYAELLYSTGDYELARKYFCYAAYLDGACLRAIWGLVAVSMALAEKDKGNEKLLQLQTFAIEKLKGLYKDAGPHGKVSIAMLKCVESGA
jgi:tetratricopeptide (TPR) repeat protein